MSFRLCCFLLAATSALACNVPVFRYALERWPSDSYLMLVFHDGPMTETQAKMVKQLKESTVGDYAEGKNYIVEAIDIQGEMHSEAAAYHEASGAKSYPWMMLQYPQSAPDEPPAFSGPLTEQLVGSVADSPVRREIARLLLKGESVVWLLLESGQAEQDSDALKRLKGELETLSKEMKLPTLDASDEKYIDPDAGPDLRLSFATVRVKRDDPNEAMLVNMLENWNPELVDKTQPMAFAFFGRGRVLPALVGDEINGDILAEACSYLIGPCSCQIKQQNPGYDVLMSVPWDDVIQGVFAIEKVLPPLTGMSGLKQAAESASSGAAARTQVVEGSGAHETSAAHAAVIVPPTTEPASNPITRNLVILLIVVAGMVVAGSVVFTRRQS
ncbi:MAG: hypothetical protein ACI8W8_002759 [Rhodothermales bacterium]|jgi:hypothetical protein